MSDGKLKIEIEDVPDTLNTIKTKTQHGLITPDGVVHWGKFTLGSQNYSIHELATANATSHTAKMFRHAMDQRLEPLGVDVEDHLAKFQFFKRTIVVSVIKPEHVKHPWIAPPQDVPF